MADDPVIASIRAAATAQPDNLALRVHLADVMLVRGFAAEAVVECRALLALAPAHAAAFEVAARAAAATGDVESAAAYRDTAALLGGPAIAVATSAAVAVATSPSAATSATASPRDVIPLHAVAGGKSDAPRPDADERPTVTLADVAGLERVKRRLHSAFLGPLANPALRREFAKSLRGGLLLYGPPGCGKTFVARALAGELRARFLTITLTDVLDAYQGDSEKNVHRLFENARRAAPCVVFIDEVDAIGQKRASLAGSMARGIVAQLLAELDSIGSNNDGMFVLAATNHPWDVDPALRRPGRFDRTLLVMPPDHAARVAIVTAHLADRPTADVDVELVAARTRRFSGADLAHLCESAAELALEASVASGHVERITTERILEALAEIRPTTTSWIQTAKNYAQFANEGGIYDELLEHLREADA